MVKAFLHPKSGYTPKLPTNVAQPIVFQAFCPPPFWTSDQEKINLLCPVRALDAYVDRAALWQKLTSCLYSLGDPGKGSQHLSRG